MLDLAQPHGPVDERRLAGLERELGLPLPAAYRTWLLRTGGGHVGRDVAVPGTGGNGILNEFFGVDRLRTAQRRTGMNHVVPGGYLLIGDGAGGVLALRTEPDSAGSVWWADWDRADELGGIPSSREPSGEIMRPLAPDFGAFVAALS